MDQRERKTTYSSRCPECGVTLLWELTDDELKQLIAGTRSFICTRRDLHKLSRDESWAPTKDEKEAFVKVLLPN